VLKSQSGLDKRKNDGEDGEGEKAERKKKTSALCYRLSAFSVLSAVSGVNLTPSLSSG
jgi:hypothetical protein